LKRRPQEILADSHIAAIAIALLLIWSIDWGFRALWVPICGALSYLLTAIAILDIPYFSVNRWSLFKLIETFSFLFGALINLAAAYYLSYWVYGVGPLRGLGRYRKLLTGRNRD
jgi:hypothetical protein